ncbi:MAG TPA: DUF1326 domain-containing protein [Bryobacteraceae bacterium]|nr:DUF1326 domain-containing protein [Bryobacteraceae bacterium]
MRCRILLTILCAGVACAGQDSPVTGQYLEDRSSRVYGCPCEFSSEYASLGREAVVAWNIESGQYQKVSLAGLRLAAVLAGKFTLSDAATLRRSVLFADSGAPALQREVGLAWLRSRYGDLLGQVLSVRAAPIEFALDADSASLRVGDLLTLRMRRANPAEETESWAFLLFDPLTKLTSATLGTTLHTESAGTDLGIRWIREEAAITGYYGRFSQP